jgi:hypothetical protein
MKKLILFLFILISTGASSQALIGYSPSEVRAKFPDKEWEYGKWGERKNLMLMTFQTDDIIVGYFFNEDQKSVICSITPLSQGTLQAMVEMYNKKYVIKDSFHWDFYNSGTVFKCSLNVTDEGVYYFLWSE